MSRVRGGDLRSDLAAERGTGAPHIRTRLHHTPMCSQAVTLETPRAADVVRFVTDHDAVA